mmetsp:Transcript_131399/g.262173  ORF Transcript_131399/g.262173 Transcript_131399/m.262173 type:complete len:85 (+) Transcript_131399:214-468(+)
MDLVDELTLLKAFHAECSSKLTKSVSMFRHHQKKRSVDLAVKLTKNNVDTSVLVLIVAVAPSFVHYRQYSCISPRFAPQWNITR